MTTATKSKSKTQDKQQSENLPALSAPRLPYHPVIEKEFGYDENAWKALVEAIFPLAKTPESVRLALSYCKARRLDPFKRCIHIVPIWDKNKRCEIDTIWPGIGELRTTAHRTGCYAGRDKTEFGPDIEETWGGGNDKVTMKFPEWAQVMVYRIVKDKRVAYAGPQIYWIETFSSVKSGAPNSMWRKRPRGQLDKCAEAAALRAAFPEEIGNDYIDAEAHAADGGRVSFEQAQMAAKQQIETKTGTEPVDAQFEANGDKETATKTETKSDAKNVPKFKYHCSACEAGFDEPRMTGPEENVASCPACKSLNVALAPDSETPEFMNRDGE